ncbi:MAG: FAD-binding oxidoreductase [Ferruginibacter sp.]
MANIVKILAIKDITHDVKSFRVEKPAGYAFTPGQATEVSVNKKGMEEEKRPFTFTSLNEDPFLEFTIKRYNNHNGVTKLLHKLHPGDELIIQDVWGAIEYKGPGYFIAGGAGITPFLSIIRQLHKTNEATKNTLIFSNKTAADIICEDELKRIMGDKFVNVLTKEHHTFYRYGYIDEGFIKENISDFSKHFYICGPDPMIVSLTEILEKMGADTDAVVFEK